MTARDFCYWLQGFFELSPAVGELSQQQTEQIRNHLHMVFAHEIDPSMGDKDHQKKLTDIHSPKPELTQAQKEQLEKDFKKALDESTKKFTDRFGELDKHVKINC